MLHNIKILHIEPTDVCQAACPLCARETDPEFNKKIKHHLTVDQLLQVVGPDLIADLDKMFMCGNYGDPAAGQHTLDIYRKFRDLNKNITLGMNTNGGLRTKHWWQELGEIFTKPTDYVVFSIDGLEDTNSIYRKGVSWDILIENAKSFIAAGGSAHWDMLVYRHNQHQVDQCKQLAKDLGFSWFRSKVSKRKSIPGVAEYPITQIQLNTNNKGPIICKALHDKSLYISARGKLYPCCWIGNTQSTVEPNFQVIQDSWNSRSPNTICVASCSTVNNVTLFDRQWRQEIYLK